MIKHLIGYSHPYKSKDRFSCIKGYEVVKAEMARLVKILEVPSNNISRIGISIVGPAGSGKYFMAETFASVINRSVYSFNVNTDLRDSIEPIISMLESVDKTGPVLLLIRHLDYLSRFYIGQLNDYLESFETEVTILATSEETDGTASYAKEIGLINYTIPVGSPTLRDTSAFLQYLLYEKYSDTEFKINLDDFAAVSYQYSYSFLDRLLQDCIRDARIEHSGSVDMDLFMEYVMCNEFNRYTIADNLSDTIIYESAIHEIGHALAGILTGEEVAYACICRRGKSSRCGYTKFLKDDLEMNVTTEGMIINLGGMVAEEICNGHVSVGSKTDINNVCSNLEELILKNGTFGIEYVNILSDGGSDEMNVFHEKKIRNELVGLYDRTKELLMPYTELIQELASQLLQKEYLLGSHIKNILNSNENYNMRKTE